MNILNLISIL